MDALRAGGRASAGGPGRAETSIHVRVRQGNRDCAAPRGVVESRAMSTTPSADIRIQTFNLRTGTCERGTPDAWKERRGDCIALMAAGGSIIVWLAVKTNHDRKIQRWAGAILLLAYGGYLTYRLMAI